MQSKSLSTAVWPIVLGVAVFVLSNGVREEALANHNKNASKERLEEILRDRLRGTGRGGKPLRLKPLPIRPANSPRALMDTATPLPDEIRSEIADSAIISVLYHDGNRIKYNWRRDDLPEDAHLFGYSMTKSIVSYLAGKVLCDGRIESLDDRIGKYARRLSGTFYGNASIIDALNMASGDRVLYRASDGPRANRVVVRKIWRGAPVIDILRGLGNPEPGAKVYDYSPGNSLAIGALLVAVSPEGFGELAGRALADDAGLASPSRFLADTNGMPQTSGRYYATRTDWLRAAIRISEQFKAEGCVGDYLRSAITESVPTGRSGYRNYGKYFRFDHPRFGFEDAAMVGHGGQRAVMDIEKGRVLVIHSMRSDYRLRTFVDAFFQ